MTFLSSRLIGRMAASGGGSIVNTASSMAHLPLGGLDGYAASKGGVAQLTRSMAVGPRPEPTAAFPATQLELVTNG